MLPVHTANYYSILILQMRNLTRQAQRNTGAEDELRHAVQACNKKNGELESANAALIVSIC
jgi:hypothetical protein